MVQADIVSSFPFRHRRRNLDAMRSPVVAHLLGIIGVNGNVVELSVMLWRISKQLDVLPVIYFHERSSDRAVITLERERLLKYEKIFVTRTRLGDRSSTARCEQHQQCEGAEYLLV